MKPAKVAYDSHGLNLSIGLPSYCSNHLLNMTHIAISERVMDPAFSLVYADTMSSDLKDIGDVRWLGVNHVIETVWEEIFIW